MGNPKPNSNRYLHLCRDRSRSLAMGQSVSRPLDSLLPNLAAFTPRKRPISLSLNDLFQKRPRALYAVRAIHCMRAGAVCPQAARHPLQLFSVRGQPARVALGFQ